MKIPEPITPPITIIVPSNRPNFLASGDASASVFKSLIVSAAAVAEAGDDHDEDNDRRDQHEDFSSTVGPFALHFTGARVDDYLKDAALEAIGADPDRQQDVLERD